MCCLSLRKLVCGNFSSISKDAHTVVLTSPIMCTSWIETYLSDELGSDKRFKSHAQLLRPSQAPQEPFILFNRTSERSSFYVGRFSPISEDTPKKRKIRACTGNHNFGSPTERCCCRLKSRCESRFTYNRSSTQFVWQRRTLTCLQNWRHIRHHCEKKFPHYSTLCTLAHHHGTIRSDRRLL